MPAGATLQQSDADYRMGVIYAGRGQYDDASAAFESAIAIEPTGKVMQAGEAILCGGYQKEDHHRESLCGCPVWALRQHDAVLFRQSDRSAGRA
jgi:hypothetical protein